jgi:hypothetical protein
VSDNFYLDEFIPPDIYRARPDHGRSLLDPRVIWVAQWVRDTTGCPVYLNNWWHGGNLDERGLRSFKASTGAEFSQHKYGRAGDISVKGMSSREVFDMIQGHSAFFLKNGWITTLENWKMTPTWTHYDCRWTASAYQILIVDTK